MTKDREVVKILVQIVFNPHETRWVYTKEEVLNQVEWNCQELVEKVTEGLVPLVTVLEER